MAWNEWLQQEAWRAIDLATPGADGITVRQLTDILKARWPENEVTT